MPFKISITEDADRQLRSLPAREQRILEAAVQARLEHQPTTPTKAIKRLRPNPLAEFELRAGDLCALYNVEGDELSSSLSGARSATNSLWKARNFMAIKTI